jgi:hypothetical protein
VFFAVADGDVTGRRDATGGRNERPEAHQ